VPRDRLISRTDTLHGYIDCRLQSWVSPGGSDKSIVGGPGISPSLSVALCLPVFIGRGIERREKSKPVREDIDTR